jgi:transcriptional regulator with XRE-family HTH domain
MSTDQTLLDELSEQVDAADRRFYRKADDVAARIRQVMERRDLTQRALAERLDKRESYVSRVLGGGVNLTLQTIAEFEEALNANLLVLPEPRRRGKRRKSFGRYKTQMYVQAGASIEGVCVDDDGKLAWQKKKEEVVVTEASSSPTEEPADAA